MEIEKPKKCCMCSMKADHVFAVVCEQCGFVHKYEGYCKKHYEMLKKKRPGFFKDIEKKKGVKKDGD